MTKLQRYRPLSDDEPNMAEDSQEGEYYWAADADAEIERLRDRLKLINGIACSVKDPYRMLSEIAELLEEPQFPRAQAFDVPGGTGPSPGSDWVNHAKITRLRALIGRMFDELVTVEYDADPPKRVIDLLKEAEQAR